MSTVEEAAMAYWRARSEHKAAKQALREYRAEHGSCTKGPYETQYESRGECFREGRRLKMSEWCEVCRGSQPMWERYRRTAAIAGVRLKMLMHACKAAEETPA